MYALFCKSIFNKKKPVCIAIANTQESLNQLVLDNIRSPYHNRANVISLNGGSTVTRYFKKGPLFDYQIPFNKSCVMCGDAIGVVHIASREEIVKHYETTLRIWDDAYSNALKIEN